MLKKQILVACVGLAVALGAGSGAFAANASRQSAAYHKVEQLIRLLDKDKNGVVTKSEFLNFASAEFDRVDADKSGSLTAQEFAHSRFAGRSAGYRDVADLVRLMDQNRTGAVEKAEFMQFISAEFDRIDADKSGTLTRQELSNSIFVHPQQSHPGGTRK
jgi:Ca2+-binding EF-hand superfamily protein